MPSPTVSTVPVSRTVTFWSYSSICLRMICEISSALISMSFLEQLFGEQLFAKLSQTGAHRAVVHEVTELRDQPADDRRVLLLLEEDHLARLLLERGLEPRLERRVERPGGGDGRAHAAGVLVDERAVGAADVGQRADAALVE